MNFKLIFPGFYTYNIRLKSIRSLLIYFYFNLIVPLIILTIVFTYDLALDTINKVLIHWALVHLVYECGYILNDYTAVDSKSNWRNLPNLTYKQLALILASKITVITLFSLFELNLIWFFLAIAIIFLYILHNSLSKPKRIITFILLRLVKFSPFFLLEDLVLVRGIMIYFLSVGVIEGIKSYYNSYAQNKYFKYAYYLPLVLFLSDVVGMIIIALLIRLPRYLNK